MKKYYIRNWHYQDGNTCPNPGMPEGGGRLDPLPRGWYCWVYSSDADEFLEWMDTHCPTADCVHRFNSGNPMYTVHITSEQEATAFSLRWI